MNKTNDTDRLHREAQFHDQWAQDMDVAQIDVIQSNEALTAPEMRYIIRQLGDIRGKTLLDIGCGLGEASVYFAMQGAKVTSSDLSERMLDATQRLADRYHVTVTPCQATAEQIGAVCNKQFDIVYAGNLFHHVDMKLTLQNIRQVLKKDGVLVSWDPVAYNPLINIYRLIARNVRTPDEHPLTLRDIHLVQNYFQHVTIRYFWLTTLLVFLCMVLVQFRNPNQERFWKVVIAESQQWAWLYTPLARLDTLLLKLFPRLGALCWNVVIVAKNP